MTAFVVGLLLFVGGMAAERGLTTWRQARPKGAVIDLDAREEAGTLVPVSVCFPVLPLTTTDLQRLRPGVTLVVSHDPDAPLDVHVGGARAFEALVNHRGDRLACVLRPTTDRDAA